MDTKHSQSWFIEKVVREKYPKSSYAWTDEEDSFIKSEYQEHVGQKFGKVKDFIATISLLLKRQPSAVRYRLEYLGLETIDSPAQKKAGDYIKPLKKIQVVPVVYGFEKNETAQKALKMLEETSKNIFITGQAGTGKSTLLNYFRQSTKKNVVVLAPTGVAAVNVGGQTIHSFCGFSPSTVIQQVKKLPENSDKRRLLEHIDTVVIDEISMVRADVLDCLEKYLRLNGKNSGESFGGYQMVFIGDLHQLPPVEKDFSQEGTLFEEYESPYFFHARCFENGNFAFVQLQTMYRQSDSSFIEILNAIRNNTVQESHLRMLNSRVVSGDDRINKEQYGMYLTATNARATAINLFFLNKIKSELLEFPGSIHGDFKTGHLPTDEIISVKVGAQIIMVNNDWQQRWVNGTMGIILKIIPADDKGNPRALVVELENGRTEWVYPYTWELNRYAIDHADNTLKNEILGTFTQYPIRLAWALTIHKSQGKTFSKVYIDLSRGTFAHGQLYVALSRCRTLDGISLNRAVHTGHIHLDERVVEFLTEFGNKNRST